MRRIVLVVLMALAALVQPASAREADPTAFTRVWERTDAPVKSGAVQRTWYWGPDPFLTTTEPYAQGADGERLVQYYDKGRMEITNPNDDPASDWYVTSGLIVREMISGKIQVGDGDFDNLRAQSLPIAGDAYDNPDAPTYASFKQVASVQLPSPGEVPLPFPYGPGPNEDTAVLPAIGRFVDATIDRAGSTDNDPSLASKYPGTRITYYSIESNHNIPDIFWRFLNSEGLIKEGENLKQDVLANWIYLTGYPITEPYWIRTMVNGVEQDVMVQAFERRVLTYTPSNPGGWQVEMGNAGLHYYRWRYETPAAPPAILPDNIDATVDPRSGPAGTEFNISLYGFQPGEEVSIWLTLPDQSVEDAPETGVANENGEVEFLGSTVITLYTFPGVPTGIWALTGYGNSSGHTSVAYFEVTD